MRHLSLIAFIAALISTPALAIENLDGYFIAQKNCEAYQSKNKLTNPGNVMTTPWMAYEMIGINKAGGDYFQVKIPDAPVTGDRWVSAACGVHVLPAGTPTSVAPTEAGPVTPPSGTESADNLLVLSWQPTFCEVKTSKTECRNLNDGLLPQAVRQLSIHGLWPQPNGKFYCGVPASVKALDKPETWDRLPPPDIDAETSDELAVAMPGFASGLHFHEWIKHGTCFQDPGGADEYFDDMLHLSDAINTSAVGSLFANNVGAEVTATEIRGKFDEAFGAGTGSRVNIKCSSDGSRRLISELWINLKGLIQPNVDLGHLLLAGDETGSDCASGIIDPAGLQ